MKRLMRSLTHAARGVLFTIRNERNFQVELVGTSIVLILMFVFPLTREERMLLVLSIVLVLAFELVNTAVERVMDILKPRVHPYARVVKDVMAGAVFVSSLGAAVLGVMIFLPYIF